MPVSKVQLPKNYQPEILELLKSNNFINNSKKVHDANADFKFDSNGKHISISSKDDDTLYNAVRDIQRQIDSIKISNIPPTCISQTLLQRIVQSEVFHGWFKNFMRDNEVNDVMLLDKKNNEIAVIATVDAKIKLFTSWLKKVVVKEHITFLHLHNETALEELGKFFSHLQSIYYIVIHVAKNSLKIEGFIPDVYPAKSLLMEKCKNISKRFTHENLNERNHKFISAFNCLEGSSCVLLEGNQVCVCSNSNRANPAILRMSLPTCNVLVEKFLFEMWGNNGLDRSNLEVISRDSRCIFSLEQRNNWTAPYITFCSDLQANITSCSDRLRKHVDQKYSKIKLSTDVKFDVESLKEAIVNDSITIERSPQMYCVTIYLLSEKFAVVERLLKNFFNKIEACMSINKFLCSFTLHFNVDRDKSRLTNEFLAPISTINVRLEETAINFKAKLPCIVKPKATGTCNANFLDYLRNHFQSNWLQLADNKIQLEFELSSTRTVPIYLENRFVDLFMPNNFARLQERSSSSVLDDLTPKNDEKLLFLPVDADFIIKTSVKPAIFYKYACHAAIESGFTGRMLICKVHIGNCYEVREGETYDSLKPPCVELSRCPLSFKDGSCRTHAWYDSAVLKKRIEIGKNSPLSATRNVHTLEKFILKDNDTNRYCPFALVEYKTSVCNPDCTII